MSGAPKIRACEIIRELEGGRRGIYGGAVGYLDFSGNMDTCIAIPLAYKKNGRVCRKRLVTPTRNTGRVSVRWR